MSLRVFLSSNGVRLIFVSIVFLTVLYSWFIVSVHINLTLAAVASLMKGISRATVDSTWTSVIESLRTPDSHVYCLFFNFLSSSKALILSPLDVMNTSSSFFTFLAVSISAPHPYFWQCSAGCQSCCLHQSLCSTRLHYWKFLKVNIGTKTDPYLSQWWAAWMPGHPPLTGWRIPLSQGDVSQ